jgi:hypothetical protein
MAKCPRCDAPIIQGDQYCGTCGVTLEPTTPPGAAPPGSRFAGAGFGAPPPPPPSLGRPGASSNPPPPWAQPATAPSPAGAIPPVPDPFLPAQPARPKHASRIWIGAFVGLVVAAGLAVGAVVLFTGNSNPYPKEWDPQVKPIADRVAQLRGLTFEHPVKVEYLSPADFQKQVTESPEDLAKEKDEIEQASAVFRAAGLLGGDVDLGQAINDTQSADVIALYDPDTKKILVRGTGPFTVETRVTLAHELTHVLQDQHFDLPKLQKEAADSKTGSTDALTGLVEGDAERIEHKYLAEQSAADRADYERLSNATADAADAQGKDVPAVIQTYFGAPYIFGPRVVSILENSGGNQAIDNALTGPTPSTRIYLDPTAVNQTPGSPPPVPALQAGEKKLSSETVSDEGFDDFTLYLMLGARLDPVTALRAADAFQAGSSTAYTTSDGKTCLRAAITGVNSASDTYLAQVIGSWAGKMPDAKVESTASPITFRSCDPGQQAVAPKESAIRNLASLAAIRDSLTESLITNNHVQPDMATCSSRLLLQDAAFRSIMNENSQSAFQQATREAARAALACRANTLAGIP